MYLSELSSKLKDHRETLVKHGSITKKDRQAIEERYQETSLPEESRPHSVCGRSVVRAKLDLLEALNNQQPDGSFSDVQKTSAILGVKIAEEEVIEMLKTIDGFDAVLHSVGSERILSTVFTVAFVDLLLLEFDELGQLKTRVTTQLGSIKQVEEEVVRENVKEEVLADLARRHLSNWRDSAMAFLNKHAPESVLFMLDAAQDLLRDVFATATHRLAVVRNPPTRFESSLSSHGGGKQQAPVRSKYISFQKQWDPFHRQHAVIKKDEGIRLPIDSHWVTVEDLKGDMKEEFWWCSGEDEDKCSGFHEGPYLCKTIGSGAFGKVFLGVYGDKACAVKTFPDEMSGDEQSIFINEITILSKLGPTNPHTVTILAASLVPPNLCLVLSLHQGGTLHDALYQQHVRLSRIQTLRIAFQVAKGLEVMHAHQLMHRDLKPDNMLFSGDHRRLVLSDFGVSTNLHLRDMINHVQFPVGTPVYMAPEVWNKQPYGHRADVFSYGAFLVELITGKPPHAEDVAVRGWEAVIHDVASSIICLRPQLPAGLMGPMTDLGKLAVSCMAAEASKRPFAAELVETLIKIGHSHNLDATSTNNPLVSLPDVPPFVPQPEHCCAPREQKSTPLQVEEEEEEEEVLEPLDELAEQAACEKQTTSSELNHSISTEMRSERERQLAAAIEKRGAVPSRLSLLKTGSEDDMKPHRYSSPPPPIREASSEDSSPSPFVRGRRPVMSPPPRKKTANVDSESPVLSPSAHETFSFSQSHTHASTGLSSKLGGSPMLRRNAELEEEKTERETGCLVDDNSKSTVTRSKSMEAQPSHVAQEDLKVVTSTIIRKKVSATTSTLAVPTNAPAGTVTTLTSCSKTKSMETIPNSTTQTVTSAVVPKKKLSVSLSSDPCPRKTAETVPSSSISVTTVKISSKKKNSTTGENNASVPDRIQTFETIVDADALTSVQASGILKHTVRDEVQPSSSNDSVRSNAVQTTVVSTRRRSLGAPPPPARETENTSSSDSGVMTVVKVGKKPSLLN